MVVPCLLIFVLAFFERGIYGGIDWNAVTLENFRRAFDPLYLSIFLDSALIAGLCDAHRPAHRLSRRLCHRQGAGANGRPPLLFLAMLPFWTNYLIRTYAWIVLLNPRRA